MSIPLVIRSIHATKDDYEAATQAVIDACEAKGFELETADGAESVPTDFAAPSLYLTHDNPLTALQYASYKASIEYAPEEFSGPADLLGVTYPVGTTGGTLASDYQNKMTAFGAVIPGNERWWHSANERISVDSIVEMTKMMADGMLEMARYSGSAGAQLMWADLPGLNADRADLDLLDVTIGTYHGDHRDLHSFPTRRSSDLTLKSTCGPPAATAPRARWRMTWAMSPAACICLWMIPTSWPIPSSCPCAWSSSTTGPAI